MPAYDGFTELLCSGIVEFPCIVDGQETTCQGLAVFPCGMRHDTRIAGDEEARQMPFRYQLWRERARLAPCCYWRDETAEVPNVRELEYNNEDPEDPKIFEFTNVTVPEGTFQVDVVVEGQEGSETINIDDPDVDLVGGWAHESSPSFVLEPRTLIPVLLGSGTIPTRCILEEATAWHQGQDGTPPCNGAKSQCPFYTGKDFRYIKDENMAIGQLITGATVQEVRSLVRDWKNLPESQDVWEQTFELPYIWDRALSDLPLIINSQLPSNVEEAPPVITLTQVYWSAEEEVAEYIKYPSEPEGTDLNSGVPSFPTIVAELGIAAPPKLKVTFPPPRFGSSSKLSETPFIYNSFHNVNHLMYVAGTVAALCNVFIVNRTINPNFPDLENKNLSNEEITKVVDQFVMRNLTYSRVSGFRVSEAGEDLFWQVRDGIDLKPNVKKNEIYVLAELGGQWEFEKFEVEYRFYHADLVQDGFVSSLPTPQTSPFTVRNASLTGDSVSFLLQNIGRKGLFIRNVYHIGTLDRSATRLVEGLDFSQAPDRRYWQIKETKIDNLEGDSLDSGNLRWTKMDNCNRYLIEIKSGLSSAPPAGMDRSWEPDQISFEIVGEDGETTDSIPMVVLSGSEDFGRSLDGSLMDVKFMIVKPEGTGIGANIKEPKPESRIKMSITTFKGGNGLEPDAFDRVVNEFNDSLFNQRQIAGVNVAPVSEGMESITNPVHSIQVTASRLNVTGASRVEMSYMVEFGIPGDSNVIGRKWIVGCGEMVNFWVRDVDIVYAWAANQSYELFKPDYARAIRDLITGEVYSTSMHSAPETLTSQTRTVYYPKCKDHEGIASGFGPMFTPYDVCPDPPLIRINDLGIYILFRIPGVDSVDEKYRGPEIQTVKTARHNVFGTITKCIWEFSIGTFTRGSSEWNGYSRIRGPISDNFNSTLATIYRFQGWRLPQLGNRGREALRVYRTPFFREYVYITEAGNPNVGLGWLPSHPYSNGPTSLFDTNRPRMLFDNQAENLGDLVAIDYNTWAGQLSLLEISPVPEEGQPLIIEPDDLNSETGSLLRLAWEHVYYIKKIASLDGSGTRFPPKGIYHNFTQNSIVWAYPEKEFELAREPIGQNDTVDTLSTPRLTGVVYRKTRSPVYPDTLLDKYDRPVFIYLPEKVYTVTIEDIQYDPNTGDVLEYPKIYINPDFPVYFDRFTGEIKNTPNDTTKSGEFQLYHIINSLGDIDSLGLDVIPFYATDPSLGDDGSVPESTEDIFEFITGGNLFVSSVVLTYATQEIEGPLSDTFTWAGFVPSLELIDIIPFILPKQVECLDTDSKFSNELVPKVTYSIYPSLSPEERSVKSGLDLNSKTEGAIVCSPPVVDSNLFWSFLRVADGSLPEEEQIGVISPVTIEYILRQPLELYSIQFSYLIKGRDTTDPALLEEFPPETDPSLRITVINTIAAEELILIDKPMIDLTVGSNRFSGLQLPRNFDFSVKNEDFKAFVFDKISIQFGARDSNTSLTISPIFIQHLAIRKTSERTVVLEPKYIPTLGYANSVVEEDNFLALGSQDRRFLTGLARNQDISDNLETSGIAEFWQPGAASLDNEVMTRGKIRRHWADRFNSFDIARYFRDEDEFADDIFFLDGSVQLAERRQFDLLVATFGTLASLPGMLNISMKPFYTPHDLHNITVLLGSDGVKKLTNTTVNYNVELLDEDGLNELSNTLVSLPNKTPGWQDPGFFACLSDKGFKTIGCIKGLSAILGIKHPHVAYTQLTQEVCRGSTQAASDQFDLLDLPGFVDTAGFLGANSSAAGATFSADKLNSLGDQIASVEEPSATGFRVRNRYKP